MIPVRYNLRSLFVRKVTTLMTVVSIAFVVLVFVGVWSLAVGLEAAFAASGDPRTVLVTRDGARSETESFVDRDGYRLVATLPGVERDVDGEMLASGELVVIQIFSRADGSEANVTVRGVEPAARVVRPAWTLVEGRDFTPGTGEIIVGQRLVGRYPDLALGGTVRFGRRDFTVVGVFTADGGGPESEVWGALTDIGAAFRREGGVSSIRLKTTSEASTAALVTAATDIQRYRLQAKREDQYYAEQTDASTAQFKILGTILAIMMGFGACFAAANTMYAQVSSRAREIGTLRAIGFRRRHVLLAFLAEAALLGLLGGLLGCVLAIPLDGISAGTTNFITFSEIAFELTLSPQLMAMGVLLAIATGVLGGLPPAIAASRRGISGLLREA
ncbi:MAG: FtsX-like permease family protein [Acidobacteriota bacterium]